LPASPPTSRPRRSCAIAGAGADLTPYLKKDGTVAMTGLLTLFGNAVNALHAVPKQQLDAAIAAAVADLTALIPSLAGYATEGYVNERVLTPWQVAVNSAAVTSAAVIPRDDTMPQIGEGVELLTLGPVNVLAGQFVELESVVNLLVNDIEACAFICRSGAADALQVGYGSSSGGATFLHSVPVSVIDTPGAGAFTYSVRFGPLGSGTAWANSSDVTPTRIHGGASKSFLRLRIGEA
jgi:hypothetical protein